MLRLLLVLTPALLTVSGGPAMAAVPHTVGEGDTLWSIAAANGLSTRALAAYNGVSPDSNVVLGSNINVPTAAEAAGAAPAAAAPTATGTAATGGPATSAAAPPPQGGYTVRPGDTLSALAARAGVPVAQMAQMNGLDPNGVLPAGTVVKLPTGAPAPAQADEPAPAQTVVPPAPPKPTGTRLDAGTVRSVAAQHGAPGGLAAAIGWQESGFNNAMVSSANARGVMQVMPGTWEWVQRNLSPRRLDPDSATDNVAAGSLYLKHLLEATGGDETTAIAGYYQGLGSVRRIGLLPETERYVANVRALRSRYGG